jgi:hypothetical protein
VQLAGGIKRAVSCGPTVQDIAWKGPLVADTFMPVFEFLEKKNCNKGIVLCGMWKSPRPRPERGVMGRWLIQSFLLSQRRE